MPTHLTARPLLLVLSVMVITSTSPAFLFSLPDIQHNVQPSNPVAEVGTSFTFNCSIHRLRQTTDLTTEDIVWKHFRSKLPDDWYHIVNDSLIQLTIPNVTVESAGNYECRKRDDNLLCGGERLQVGYPPDKPVFERCQSDSLGPFTCWWNRGRDPIIHTTYNLTYTFNDNTGKVHRCPTMGDNYCLWSSNVNYGSLRNMTLSATNALGTASVWLVLDPEFEVKPGNVRELRTPEVGSDSLSVRWQYPVGLEPSHFPLFYTVRYKGEWDNQYMEQNASQDLSLELRRLNPYTVYTICVMSHPIDLDWEQTTPTPDDFKGYWSDCAPSHSVRTQEAAPSGKVEAWLLVTQDGDHRRVKVFWKPLPPWDRHSEWVDYVISILPRSEQGTIISSQEKTFSFDNQTVDSGDVLQSEVFESGRSYEIRISANNSHGHTDYTTMTVPKSQDTPSAPTDLRSEFVDDDTIQLSWTRLPSAQTRLRGYVVFWKEWIPVNNLYRWEEKGWEHVDGSQSTFAVTGLRVAVPTRFKFGVLADTVGGFGTETYVDDYTNTGEPQGQVEDVEVTSAGPDALNVTWTPLALERRNGRLLGYRIRYCRVSVGPAECPDACTQTREVNALGEETTSHQLRGLSPFTTYRVQVVAFNSEGSTAPSGSPTCQLTGQAGPADAPSNLTVDIVQPTLVTLNWIPPATPNGVITKYISRVNGAAEELFVSTPVFNLAVDGDTSYNISIQACTINRLGETECGPLSDQVSFRTPIGAPGAPAIPMKESATADGSSIVLKLTAPAHPNGPIHQYVVFYHPENSTQVLNVTAPPDAQTVKVSIDNCDGPVKYIFYVRAVTQDADGKLLEGEQSPNFEQEMCGPGAAPTGNAVRVEIIVIVAALVVTLLIVGWLFKRNKESLKQKLFPHVPGPALPYYDEMIDPYDTYSRIDFPVNYSYNNEREQVDNIADFLGERVLLVREDDNMNTLPISEANEKTGKKPLDEETPTEDHRSSGYSTSTDPIVSEPDTTDESQPNTPKHTSKESGASIAPYTKFGGTGGNITDVSLPEKQAEKVSVSPEGIELTDMKSSPVGDYMARSPENPVQDVPDYIKSVQGMVDYVQMGGGSDYGTNSGTKTPDYLQTYTLRNDARMAPKEAPQPMPGYVRASAKPGQFVEPAYQTRYSLESLPVTSGSSGYVSNESQPSTTAEPPSPDSPLKNYISKSMPNILQGFPFAPATVSGVTVAPATVTGVTTLPPSPRDQGGVYTQRHGNPNDTPYIKKAGEINV